MSGIDNRLSTTQWRAIRWMILSITAFTVMNFFVKRMSHYSAWQLAFFRAGGTVLVTMPLLLSMRINILGNKRRLLVARAVIGTTSLLLYFAALQRIPLGTCVALRYTSPIFAAFFALFVLSERVRVLQWLFFTISFAGVLTIKGLSDEVSWLGLALILGSGALSGLVAVVIRRIGHRDHPLVIVNYFMVFCTLIGLAGALVNWQPLRPTDLPYLASLGLFGFLGQYYMTRATQIETIGFVAPMKYLEIPFSILLGMTFLGERYAWYSLMGMGLILLGISANIWYSRYSARPRSASVSDTLD